MRLREIGSELLRTGRRKNGHSQKKLCDILPEDDCFSYPGCSLKSPLSRIVAGFARGEANLDELRKKSLLFLRLAALFLGPVEPGQLFFCSRKKANPAVRKRADVQRRGIGQRGPKALCVWIGIDFMPTPTVSAKWLEFINSSRYVG